ncbi:hypothetical protein E1161_07520 [Saccharopolyspora aridisoli]|uniref:Uncharacterized protein n=1 Tax=Saccharopolyspora aridisoli TaxID=2530385 RepID=A0A4R4UV54_9PSEU|nr:hypothetical protein [Saccharopolyspora aridisoli]TDC94386.1 hypothetical protein E1161_07520 [Saccharopolyspora aridisoli]
MARLRPAMPFVTALGAFDGSQVIGAAGHHSTAITLPGGRTAPSAESRSWASSRGTAAAAC